MRFVSDRVRYKGNVGPLIKKEIVELEIKKMICRPEIRPDYPLNLSILISGGKETNKDSLSSGERSGMSPAPNPAPSGVGNCGVRVGPQCNDLSSKSS